MKSRITIEVDFENENQPVIQIIQRESDDVRDRLIAAFLGRLQSSSNWCHIEWAYYAPHDAADNFAKILIRTISPAELPEELKEMSERVNENDRMKSILSRGESMVIQ